MAHVWDKNKFAYANGPAITTVSQAAAAPTKAEYDTLVAAFNALLQACRDAGIIST